MRRALARAARWIGDAIESFAWSLHDLADWIYEETEHDAEFDRMTAEIRIAIDRLNTRIEAKAAGATVTLPPLFTEDDDA